MGRRRRLSRTPALHFALAGLLLFAADRMWRTDAENAAEDAQRRPIVVRSDDVERVRRDFERRHGVAPDASEQRALLDQEIDEEVLYREALARGLDEGDRSITWWLIRKMRFVADDPDRSDEELLRQARELGLDEDDVVIRRILAQKMRLLAETAEGPVEPDEEEVRAYFEENREDWRQPSRVSLHHVFLSRDRRGERVEEDARRLLSELAGLGPEEAADRGDPFPLGRSHRARSEDQLAKLFGPAFAAGVMELPEGAWSGPVASAYGLHLVYVDEKLPSEPEALEAVHNQVSRRLAAERRADVLARQLARMRERYEIVVEESDGGGSRDGS